MPLRTRSIVPYLVIAAIIVVALVLCYLFGTFSSDATGFSGHMEFTF